MRTNLIVRPPTLATLLLLIALGHASASRAVQRLQAPELISLPAIALGDLAVGDIDGNGLPEIASFGSDKRVHVLERQNGVWKEVFESTSGVGVDAVNYTPTVRFTNQIAIAPGTGYFNGQFLFNAKEPGEIIVSIRKSMGGTWEELVLFEPLPGIASNGAFSPPGLLRAEHNSTEVWRIVAPGGSAFDPPMYADLPSIGQVPPYPHMDYATGGNGYCDVEGTSETPDARIGDFDGDGTNEVALLRPTRVFVTGTLAATSAGNPGTCWPYQVNPVPTTVGHGQMLAGRLNGDATTDLVVRDGDGTLRRMLATPGVSNPYTFQITTLPSSVPGPAISSDMESADLDGDLDLDLVQSIVSPPGVEVLLNDGAGNFTSHFIPLSLSNGAVGAIAIGDMDRDGKLDLVLAQPNASPPRILILPGHGDGTFGLVAGASLGTLEPSALAITDLDDDAKPDVIVGGHDSDLTDGPQPMLLFHALGGGAFAAPTQVNGPFVNTYGGLRRIVPFRSESSEPVGIAALQVDTEQEAAGNGDGTLGPLYATYNALTSTLTGLDRADMDGDGVVDRIRLEVLSGGGSSVVTINGGDATVPLPGVQSGVRAVDWNGDGKLDLVTVNHDANQVEVRLMDASGNFTFPTLLSYPLGVAALTGYGNRAVAFVVLPFAASSTHRALMVREFDSVTSHSMLQLVQNEPPTIGAIYDVGVTTGGTPIGIDTGDVTGDGIVDVVLGELSNTANESFVSVLRGLPVADTFEPYAVFVLPGTTLNALAVGDITGDGEGDLLTVTDATLVTSLKANGPLAINTAGTGQFVLVRSRLVPAEYTGVDKPSAPAHGISMALAPNPARGVAARLSFSLPTTERVTVDLIDLSGRRLRRVLDAERTVGGHTETITMLDASGQALPAGVYFLKLRAGSVSGARQLVVVH